MTWTPRHLLSVTDLTRDDVEDLLARASHYSSYQGFGRHKKFDTLRGRTVINLFFEDSTRTRASFEIAGKWLGADTINITGKGSSTSKGESLRDTVLTIGTMGVDALVIRHSASGACHQVARWLPGTAIINAGDGTHEHPSQALLDLYTLRHAFGDVTGKYVAIVGDLTHSRVFRSNVQLLRLMGAEVTVVAPPTLLPSGIGSWAASAGFSVAGDLDATLAEGPDAVMMLRVQRERMSGGYFPTPREYTIGYGMTPDRWRAARAANPDAVLLHPGPMNRGLEIASWSADHEAALVLDQVAAGVATRMAILEHLLTPAKEALSA